MVKNWKVMNNSGKEKSEFVALEYEGKPTLIVKKSDFDRAFGAIINASYEEVKEEFSIK